MKVWCAAVAEKYEELTQGDVSAVVKESNIESENKEEHDQAFEDLDLKSEFVNNFVSATIAGNAFHSKTIMLAAGGNQAGTLINLRKVRSILDIPPGLSLLNASTSEKLLACILSTAKQSGNHSGAPSS